MFFSDKKVYTSEICFWGIMYVFTKKQKHWQRKHGFETFSTCAQIITRLFHNLKID